MKTAVSLVLLMLLANSVARAQFQGTGAGVIVGEPLGFSFKTWLNQRAAVDAGIGYSFRGDERMQLHVDYLFHQFDLFPYPFEHTPLYYGVGARVKLVDDYRVGIRAPVGASFPLPNTPADVFAEVAPILDFAPGFHFDFNAAVGVRYWF